MTVRNPRVVLRAADGTLIKTIEVDDLSVSKGWNASYEEPIETVPRRVFITYGDITAANDVHGGDTDQRRILFDESVETILECAFLRNDSVDVPANHQGEITAFLHT